MTYWIPADDYRLKYLWREGYSFDEIRNLLSVHRTRAAIKARLYQWAKDPSGSWTFYYCPYGAYGNSVKLKEEVEAKEPVFELDEPKEPVFELGEAKVAKKSKRS